MRSEMRGLLVAGALSLSWAVWAPVGSAQMAPFVGDKSAFFEPPSPASLPTENGELIRYQAYTDANGLPVPSVYRVLYRSSVPRTILGSKVDVPIVTSGLVRIPDATPPVGGFQTLAFTHGTIGLIPECGPSRRGPIWQPWMLSDNVKTVAADYPGLGVDSGLRSSDAAYWSYHPWYFGWVKQYPFDETTHPYSNTESEGRSTIDIVRAGQQLEAALCGLVAPAGDVGTNPEFAVVGSSQGGHAALGTGEMMSKGYAPELELLAILAGAPGSELQDLTSIDSALVGSFVPLLLVGASVSYDTVHPSLYMTTIGQANYERTTEALCIGGGDDYAWWIANMTYSYPLNLTVEALAAKPEYQVYALENSPGHLPIQAPILVGQIEGDPLVMRARTDAMVARLKTQPGIELTYCVYAGNGASGTGALAMLSKMENHLDVTARLYDGVSANCTDESGTPVTSGHTVPSFLAAHGFNL